MIEDIIKNGGILQFSAGWCGPCKALSKTFESNSDKLSSVRRHYVDLDHHQEIATQHNVRSVPTLILFKDGKEVKRLIGNKTLEELIEFIK